MRARTFRQALPAVLLITFMFFLNYTARSIFSPLLGDLEQAFGLDHAGATNLLFLLSCGFCSSMLLSGFIISSIRPRMVVAFSAIGCGVVLVALPQAIEVHVVWTLFIALGLSAGLYFTSAIACLGGFVTLEDWPKAMSVHELAPPLSFILAPLLAATIRSFSDWRGVLHFLGGLCIAGGLLFLFKGRGGEGTMQPISLKGLGKYARSPILWCFAWLLGLGVAGEFAPYSVLHLYLTGDKGLRTEEAAALLSFSRMGAPFAVILGGVMAGRIKPARLVAVYLALHGASLIMLASGNFSVFCVAMFLQPMLTAWVFPAIFSLLPNHFTMEEQPLLLGLCTPLASGIGGGIMPAFLGLCGTHASFKTGFVIMGLLYIATLLVMPLLLRGRAAGFHR